MVNVVRLGMLLKDKGMPKSQKFININSREATDSMN